MARSLEEIISIIEGKAAEFPALAEMENNPSRVAEWRSAKQVMAFTVRNMEEIIDAHKREVATLIVASENGLISWYRERILEYQHGDVFSLVNNVIVYNQISIDNRIIAHCAIKEAGDGMLIVRVSKDINGQLEPLTAEEVSGLAVYIKAFKFAGAKVDLASLPPNSVRYSIDVEVDQSVINLEGQNIDGSSQTPIVDAINNYHRNIGEKGIIYLSKVVDAIQAVPGIIDVQINEAAIFDGVWQVINRKHEGEATYYRLNEAETNINYF